MPLTFDIALKKRFTTSSSEMALVDIDGADHLLIHDTTADTVFKLTISNLSSYLSTSFGFTELAQDAAASLIQNGTGISWLYNDGANTLIPTVTLAPFSTTNLSEGSNLYYTDERAQDAIGSALTDTSEIDFTYNDAGNSITAAIKTNSIVYSKIQQVSAANLILGRITAGAGNIEELTAANIATIIAAITQTWSNTHTFSAAVGVLLSNATPRIAWVETDQTTDETRWDAQTNGKAWALRTRTDVDGAGVDIIRATRGTGTALASIAFGNATNNPSYSFLGTGSVTLATVVINGSTMPANGFYLPAANTLGVAAGSALAAVWDANGRYLSGTTSSISTGNISGQLQLHAAGSVGSAITRYSANSTGCNSFLGKSRSATVVVGGAVQSGDNLGRRGWAGDDGTNLNSIAAAIDGICDGTVATGQVPGRIDISTANSAGALTLAMRFDSSQDSLAQGNLKVAIVGKGLYIKEGSNATMGVATLVAGTATISTTKVTANSRIHLTTQTLGTILIPAAVGITARVAGTSFTITSAQATDTSVVAWFLVEPA